MLEQAGDMGGNERRWINLIAIECLLVGLLLNASVVSRMLASQATLYSVPFQTGILALQVAFIGLGLFCFLRPRRGMLPKLALVAASVLLCVTANVAFIQVFYHPSEIRCGWRSWGPPNQSNQFGFRGRPISHDSGDFVVLLVGDSQVEALGCRYERMPERLLETHLRTLGYPAKVFSLGASGYGQDQQWIVLQEFFRSHRADLVVLWETPGNDIWNNTFPYHGLHGPPKPTFWLERGELRGPNQRLGELMDTSPIKAATLWKRAMRKQPFGRREEEVKCEERLPPAYQPLRNFNQPVNHKLDAFGRGPLGLALFERLSTEESQFAFYLTPPSPRMEYGIALTRELLKRIQQCVQNQGGKFVIFHVATPQEVIGMEEEVYEFRGKHFRACVRQAMETTRRLNMGFQAFEIPVTVQDWSVSESDRHLNERANDQVMGDLARHLRDFVPVRPGVESVPTK